MDFQTQNPSTGETLKTYKYLSVEEARRRLRELSDRQKKWAALSAEERATVLRAWAQRLDERKDAFAKQMALEMGKPVFDGEGEVDKCAFTARYFADKGPLWLQNDRLEAHYSETWVQYQPLGCVLAIMPWNFPLWQLTRFAAPAMMVGNLLALKHANIVAGFAEMIEESSRGLFGDGPLMANLCIDHDTAAELMDDPLIRGVTFTGSSKGGRAVAAHAGRSLKKMVLELGGSDPYLVLHDADVEKAAKVCAAARLVNNGQSCIAAKRFFVHHALKKDFLRQFTAAMEAVPAGDPLKKETRRGPLASKKFQETVHDQVKLLMGQGGHKIAGGVLPDGPGCYYPVTVIDFETAPEQLGDIEVFGPVASVVTIHSDEEAIELANKSIYGLGGAIFTRDETRARHIASRIESGFVAINDSVKSDARAPFGGVKDSGFGRELGRQGFFEFANVKTVGVSR